MSIIGQQLNEYLILDEIGRGGMSVVYRARDKERGRTVALKVLHPHLVHDRTTVRRFKLEGENGLRLQHPNIVRFYATGEVEPYHYIAMRYVEEGTLADRFLQRQTAMSLDEALPILQQVAAALDYAHDMGMLHRDIKPSNILIDAQGQAYLTDFGVARPMTSDYTMVTVAGVSVGTPAFMSPEQARGDDDLDRRADVYSLGVVAFTMLTGRLPFDATSQFALLRQIVDEKPAGLDQLRETLPPGVAYALERVLAKNPVHRYATAGEFADALELGRSWTPTATDLVFLSRIHQTQERQITPTTYATQPQAPARRSKRVAAALMLLLVLIAFGVFWALGGGAQVPSMLEAVGVGMAPTRNQSETGQAVAAALATQTPAPTATPVPTFTATATPPPTATPDATATATAAAGAIAQAVAATLTAEATDTPTTTPTSSPTATHTPSATTTPSPPPTPDGSATAAVAANAIAQAVAATLTAQVTPTPTPTAIATNTGTPTPDQTATEAASARKVAQAVAATLTAQVTDTPSATATATRTPPSTRTPTATPTATRRPTSTSRPTPTRKPTSTPTATPKPTSTPRPTSTREPTPKPTPTLTSSQTYPAPIITGPTSERSFKTVDDIQLDWMQVSDQPLPDDVEYVVWIWSDQTPDMRGTTTRDTYLKLSEDRWLIDKLGGTEFSWYVQVAQLIPTDNDSSTLNNLSPESETRTFRLGTRAPADSETPSAEDASATITTDAPTILSPQDGSAFDQNAIILLEWTPVKPQLADDELYVILIQFEHTDQIWTDKAWTRNTSWHLNEHKYLLDVATGTRFEWSVKLIRQTGEDGSGVPIGDALSPSSATRVFYWARTTSGGSSSGGGGPYPGDNGGGSDGGSDNGYP